MILDLQELVGSFLKVGYLENKMTIERIQEIAGEITALDKLDPRTLNLEVAKLGQKFPEINPVIVKYLASI